MGAVDQFLDRLKNFDKKHIPTAVIQQVKPYLKIPGFTGEKVKPKSAAAAGICDWVNRKNTISPTCFCNFNIFLSVIIH